MPQPSLLGPAYNRWVCSSPEGPGVHVTARQHARSVRFKLETCVPLQGQHLLRLTTPCDTCS